MPPKNVAFRLDIKDPDAFARHCEQIGHDDTLEQLYADPNSGIVREEMESNLQTMRDFFAGSLALFLAKRSTMRSSGYSVLRGNEVSAEFSCAEAADRVIAEVCKSCPPGLELVDVSSEVQ